MKEIFILGGPNGAGKTTAAEVLLPQELRLNFFLNADEIVRQLSPGDFDLTELRAGKLMLRRMRELIRNDQSFAFETTCSGKSHLRTLKECQQMGWTVSLLFLWLPSAEECIQRVRQRVLAGGHSILEDVIRRRYEAGVRNMCDLYLPLADNVRVYDNTARQQRLVAEKGMSGQLVIIDKMAWSKICQVTL